MEWSKTHVHSTLHICWGAQAGLYYHYGVPKRPLPEKLFGVFRHTVEEPNFMLFRGFDDEFWVPHSRNTTILREDIEKVPELKIMSCSEKAGVYAVKTRDGKQVFLMGHAEYDRDTLLREYLRDVAANVPIHVPEHYFPERRCEQDAACHVALVCAPAVRQLAQLLCLPDRAVRHHAHPVRRANGRINEIPAIAACAAVAGIFCVQKRNV